MHTAIAVCSLQMLLISQVSNTIAMSNLYTVAELTQTSAQTCWLAKACNPLLSSSEAVDRSRAPYTGDALERSLLQPAWKVQKGHAEAFKTSKLQTGLHAYTATAVNIAEKQRLLKATVIASAHS